MTIDATDYEPRPTPPPPADAETCDQLGCPFAELPHATRHAHS